MATCTRACLHCTKTGACREAFRRLRAGMPELSDAQLRGLATAPIGRECPGFVTQVIQEVLPVQSVSPTGDL